MSIQSISSRSWFNILAYPTGVCLSVYDSGAFDLSVCGYHTGELLYIGLGSDPPADMGLFLLRHGRQYQQLLRSCNFTVACKLQLCRHCKGKGKGKGVDLYGA